MTSNKGKGEHKGRFKGKNGGRRLGPAISGYYGARVEVGFCRIKTGLHLPEITRRCSACSSCCFIVCSVPGDALRLRECA